jgi:hypothetical protein
VIHSLRGIEGAAHAQLLGAPTLSSLRAERLSELTSLTPENLQKSLGSEQRMLGAKHCHDRKYREGEPGRCFQARA